MAGGVIIPTRMELSRLKGKLMTARRGHKLLKDKLDELMRQFLERIKEAYRLRLEVEQKLAGSGRQFTLARAGMSDQEVNTVVISPSGQLEIKVQRDNIMSIKAFKLEANSVSVLQNPYGFAFTSIELDSAFKSINDIAKPLVKLASLEAALELMADEIEKTRRRVNALEHIMIPELVSGIRYITMKLDENERATRIRLMKVKDMLLKEQHDKRHPENPWY